MSSLVLLSTTPGSLVTTEIPLRYSMTLVPAQKGVTYSLVDQATGKAVEDLVLTKLGDGLVLEVDGVIVAEINGFYAAGQNAVFNTGAVAASGEAVVITNSAAEIANGLVWQAGEGASAAAAAGSGAAAGTGLSTLTLVGGGVAVVAGAGLLLLDSGDKDTQGPSLAITDNKSSTTSGIVLYTFTFSEDVTGFTAADITVTGGSKGAFSTVSATQYTLQVTPNADSTADIVVSVAADAAQDAAGNGNTAAQQTQAVDTVAPTIAISDDTAGTANLAGNVLYTFDFSEPVIGFTSADVQVAGGTKGSFTQLSSTRYTLEITPNPDSTANITVDVPFGAARDSVGNFSTAAEQSTQAVNTVSPTVVISDDTDGVASSDVLYTFTFSEGVNGFSVDDVSVTGGTKASDFTSGVDGDSVYTLLVTPANNSTENIVVNVAANVVQNGAGNPNTAATETIQAVNTSQPVITITDDTDGVATGDVTYTFTFSEAVTGFTVDDVTVTGGTKAADFATGADGDSVYTLVVTPDANSTTDMVVSVAAGVAQDADSFPNEAAESTQAVDTAAPSVVISDDTPGTANSQQAVIYTFTFSEGVNGFNVDDIAVTGGTKATGFTSGVDGDSVYTLEVTPDVDSTTAMTVDVPADVATDGAGNSNTAATQSVQDVDTVIPVITNVSIADSAMVVGDVVDVTITVENDDGDTFENIAGNIGGFELTNLARVAPPLGGIFGPGSTSYTAQFTVTQGGQDVAADEDIPVFLTLNDSSGNTSAPYTTPISQAADSIDANAPVILAVGIPDAPMKVGDTVTATITVEDDGGSAFTNLTGNIAGFDVANLTRLSNTSYTADFTVTEGGTDVAAGEEIPVSISLDDDAGNTSAAFDTPINQAADSIDANSPTISAVSIPDQAMVVGDIVTATITVNDDGGNPLSAASGTIGGLQVSDLTRIDSTTYTVQFAVVEGGADVAAGDDIPVSIVVEDSAGNTSAAYVTPISQGADQIDANSPTIAITDDVAGIANGPVTYTFTFSEGVNGFTVDDVIVTGGTKAANFASGVDGDSVYTLIITPDADSTTVITVDVAAAVANDIAGNPNTAATQSTQEVDTIAPDVAITDDTDGIATGPVTYTFTFTEGVTGFASSDVVVVGGTSAASFASGTDGDSVYTLLVTPDPNSSAPITVDVPAGVASDAAGNQNTAATQSTQAVDTASPNVVITDDTAGTATGPVTYTFTFSEAVNGFTVDDVVVNGGSKAANFASGVDGDSVYTLVVTPALNSTAPITVDVPAAVAVDQTGGDNNLAASQNIQAVDTVVPVINAVSIPNAPMKVGDVVTATITVVNDSDDVYTVVAGTIAGFDLGNLTQVDDSTYTAQFTVIEDGTDVAAGDDIPISVTVTDSAGNVSTPFTTPISKANDSIDANAPVITAVAVPDAPMKVGDTVTATLTVEDDGGSGFTNLTGNIGGFALSDLIRVSNTEYTADFTVTEGGTDVAAGDDIPVNITLDDAAGNTSATFVTPISQAADSIDANSPIISAVSIPAEVMVVGDVVTATITVTNDGGFPYSNLMGNIAGFALSDLTRVNSTTYTARFTVVEGGADISQGEDIPLSLSLDDTAGNTSNIYTTPISQSGDPIDVNPVVDSVAITSATGIQNSLLNTGDVVSATVTMSQATEVALNNGVPTLSLNIGGTVVQASYVSGSGSTALVFNYTILSGQTDTNGISIDANSLALNGGTLTDPTGNAATITHAAVPDNPNFAVDTTAPTVIITDDTPGTANSNAPVTYTFTFSEPVTGFTVGDVVVTGGSKAANFATGGDGDTIYTLVITPDANSTAPITVDVAAGVAQDVAGNGNTAATQSVQAVDTVLPTVAITDDTPSTANSNAPVTFTFTFSEPVTGFTVEDVIVTGGTTPTSFASGVNGDSVYSLVITPSPNSTAPITVDLAAGLVQDVAGNGNTAATQSVQAVDTVLPTVAITDDTSSTANSIFPVTFTFTFSEPVTGFMVEDVIVTGGSKAANFATGVDGDTIYTLVITPDANSTAPITVDVAAGVVQDVAGNGNTAAIQSVQAVDTVLPTVAITDDSDGPANGPVLFTFTFSEPVSGFEASDISVSSGTKDTFTAVSSTVYTLSVIPNDQSEGNIFVDVPAAIAGDGVGNGNTAAEQHFQAFDTLAPSLAATTPSDNAAAVDPDSNITLTFDDAVTVGTGSIRLVNDSSGLTASFDVTSDIVSGSGTNTITITPPQGLEAGTDYHVEFDATAFTDMAGNAADGISNPADFNFTTVDTAIVVFDLVNGKSSSHSGRQFEEGIDYAIYLVVGETPGELQLPSGNEWSGWSNLGAGDRLIVTSTAEPKFGPNSRPITTISRSTFTGAGLMAVYYKTPSSGRPLAIQVTSNTSTLPTIGGGIHSFQHRRVNITQETPFDRERLATNSVPTASIGFDYLATLAAAVITSQGLA